MKKIFFSLFAIAAIAACTKSEVAYEQTDEIGFNVVSGKMTKAAVEGTEYPTGLNMYVFAMTDNNGVTSTNPDYLRNAEFKYSSTATENEDNQIAANGTKNLWAGATEPYYWPNVTPLYFAGVSKSGNVNNTVVPTYSNGVITIDGYEPGTGTTQLGNNDLMWFPKTPRTYTKADKYVDVDMKHACSWITVKIGGDAYTAGKYTVTDVHIEGLTIKGKAELGSTAVWTLPTSGEYTDKNYSVYADATGTALPSTPAVYENNNSTIVLPNQIPGDLSIKYHFTSQAGTKIEEIVEGSLKFDGDKVWEPGVHYTYTVSITATQILIQPDVTDWTTSPEEGGHGVTVQ